MSTFSPAIANELLDLVHLIDDLATRYHGRGMVPASEVVDALLDIRTVWLGVVLADE
jgi:hypothetical protein